MAQVAPSTRPTGRRAVEIAASAHTDESPVSVIAASRHSWCTNARTARLAAAFVLPSGQPGAEFDEGRALTRVADATDA